MQFKKLLLVGMLLVGSAFAITSCKSAKKAETVDHEITGKIEKGDVQSVKDGVCTIYGLDEKGDPKGDEVKARFNSDNSTYKADKIPKDAKILVISCDVTSYRDESTVKLAGEKGDIVNNEVILTTVADPAAEISNINVLTTLATTEAVENAKKKEIENEKESNRTPLPIVYPALQEAMTHAYYKITGQYRTNSYLIAADKIDNSDSLDSKDVRAVTVTVLALQKDHHSFNDIFANKNLSDTDLKAAYAKAQDSIFVKSGGSTGTGMSHETPFGGMWVMAPADLEVGYAPKEGYKIELAENYKDTDPINFKVKVTGKAGKYLLVSDGTATSAIFSDVIKAGDSAEVDSTDISSLFTIAKAPKTLYLCIVDSNDKDETGCKEGTEGAVKLTISIALAQLGTMYSKEVVYSDASGDEIEGYQLQLPKIGYTPGKTKTTVSIDVTNITETFSIMGDPKFLVVSDGTTAVASTKTVMHYEEKKKITTGDIKDLISATAADQKQLFVCLLDKTTTDGRDCDLSVAGYAKLTVTIDDTLPPETEISSLLTNVTKKPEAAHWSRDPHTTKYIIDLPNGYTEATDVNFGVEVIHANNNFLVISNGKEAVSSLIMAPAIDANVEIDNINTLLTGITEAKPANLFMCIAADIPTDGTKCKAGDSAATLDVYVTGALGEASSTNLNWDSNAAGYTLTLPSDYTDGDSANFGIMVTGKKGQYLVISDGKTKAVPSAAAISDPVAPATATEVESDDIKSLLTGITSSAKPVNLFVCVLPLPPNSSPKGTDCNASVKGYAKLTVLVKD